MSMTHDPLRFLGRALPARAMLLRLGVDDEPPRRGVLPDGGAGADSRALRHRDRRDELHVGADLHLVFDHGAVLARAVVVAGDGARPDVDVAADRGVADIGEMVRLGARSDAARLDLDEIPDVHLGRELRAGTDTRVRPDAAARADLSFVDEAER